MNNIIIEMTYLGMEQRDSQKSGNRYFLAKFMDGNSAIFEFYVAGDRVALVTDLAQSAVLTKVKVALALKSYKGKAEVELAGVQAGK